MGKPPVIRMVLDWNQIEKLFKDMYQDIRRLKSQESPMREANYMNLLTEFQSRLMKCGEAVQDKQ